MNIRIGNDVRINALIYDGDNDLNVRFVRAYLVNMTLMRIHKRALEKATRFIGRFPKEPVINSYISDCYNINGCGPAVYNQYPREYYTADYHGFGVKPNWPDIYRPACFNLPHVYEALVLFTDLKNVISVLFPADALLFRGDYSLIIRYSMYKPGYRENNVEIRTVDYDDIFTMVGTSCCEDAESYDINVGFETAAEDLPQDTLNNEHA